LERLGDWYFFHKSILTEIHIFEANEFNWRMMFPHLDEYAKNNPKKLWLFLKKEQLADKWANLIWPIRSFYYDVQDKLYDGPAKIQLPTLSCREGVDHGKLMLHSNFQILVDFIEIEMSNDAHDAAKNLGYNPRKLKPGRRYPDIGLENLRILSEYLPSDPYGEAIFLYKWWTQVELPRHRGPDLHIPFRELFRKEVREFNKFKYAEQNEMLSKLMGMRHRLFG